MTSQSQLCDAVARRNIVTIQDRNGRTRVVEPYMVYDTSTGKRCLHCYQLSGYSSSGQPIGWKNPQLTDISAVMVHAETFQQRSEYNPFNREMFPQIHCQV